MKDKTQNQKVNVKLNEQNPEPIELIAETIIKISDGIQKLNKSPLTKRAMLILIQANCGMVGNGMKRKKPTVSQVEEVLDSLSTLRQTYLKDITDKK